MDISFRILSVKATPEPLRQHLTQQNQGSLPSVRADEMTGKAPLGGPVGKKDGWVASVSVRWSAREANPSAPHSHSHSSSIQRQFAFHVSNEEQCVTDKGASSLLLCCLWLELDAGKNGNSQCECFFSSLTGYGWACTLYIADGTIVNTVIRRKEWIIAPPTHPQLAKKTRNFFTMICMYVSA